MSKVKGSTAERELIHLFWEKGWAAMRAAGSGSTSHLCPDIIAGKDGRIIAIECKSITDGVRYIPKEQICDLEEFCRIMGAECYIGVRFNRKEWHFVLPEETKDNATLKLSVDEIKLKGLLLDELLSLKPN